ncbi:hypothetical protein [Streptomyces sp. NBC_00069]|uniref:hypothetical protein n=1 Tax=Streptomyces sp. NBC_00069 TaxID=2975639 RepID=UPI003253B2E0
MAESGSLAAVVFEGKTIEVRTRQFDDKFKPVFARLVQAEVTARLVGTGSSRALLAQTVQYRKDLGNTLLDGGLGLIDLEKFSERYTAEVTKYEKAVNSFLDRAETEVL